MMEPCKCGNLRPYFKTMDGECNKCIKPRSKITIEQPKKRINFVKNRMVKVVWGTGGIVRYFKSAKDAATFCGMSDSSMLRMVAGKRNMRGYGFMAFEMTPEEIADAAAGRISIQKPVPGGLTNTKTNTIRKP